MVQWELIVYLHRGQDPDAVHVHRGAGGRRHASKRHERCGAHDREVLGGAAGQDLRHAPLRDLLLRQGHLRDRISATIATKVSDLAELSDFGFE